MPLAGSILEILSYVPSQAENSKPLNMSHVFSKNLEFICKNFFTYMNACKESRMKLWCIWESSNSTTCNSHTSGMPWQYAVTHFLQQTYPRHPPGLVSALTLLPKRSPGQSGLCLVIWVSEMQHAHLNSWNKGSTKLKMNEYLFHRIKLLKSEKTPAFLKRPLFPSLLSTKLLSRTGQINHILLEKTVQHLKFFSAPSIDNCVADQ